MFVLATRWIRPEPGKANSVFGLDRSAIPFIRTSVNLWRHPALDVPPIQRQILGHFSQFHTFSNNVPVSVAVRPAPADQRQARPTPNDSKIWFAKAIESACRRHAIADLRWCVVSFSCDLNQAAHQCTKKKGAASPPLPDEGYWLPTNSPSGSRGC